MNTLRPNRAGWRRRTRAALCALVLLAVACTPGGPDGGVDAELATEGVLVVATNLTFEPFEFVEDGEPAGFDIDLMTEIAGRLGLEPRFVDAPFDELFDRLEQDAADAAISAIAITDRRAAVVAFSDPYFVVNQAVVVAADGPAALDDLRGQQVAVEVGTTSLDVASAELPEQTRIIEFPTSEAAFAAVEAGQAAAVVVDAPTASERVEASAGGLEILEQIETQERYGIAVAQGDDQLLADINEALAGAFDDGTYAEIYRRWFQGPVPEQPPGQE